MSLCQQIASTMPILLIMYLCVIHQSRCRLDILQQQNHRTQGHINLQTVEEQKHRMQCAPYFCNRVNSQQSHSDICIDVRCISVYWY